MPDALHADDAERSLLGGLLLDPSAADLVLPIVEEGDFGSAANRHLFAAILENISTGRGLDTLSLLETLRRRGTLDAVGGAESLANLAAEAEGVSALRDHAKIVREKSRLRRLLEALAGGARKIREGASPAEDLLDDVEKMVFAATEDRGGEGPFAVADLLDPVVERIEAMSRRKSQYTGLAVGMSELDKVTSGFQEGNLVILAARPSIGKTSLALSWMRHVAIEKEQGVLFFSLEMSAAEILLRLLSQVSGIPFRLLRDGRVAAGDWTRVLEAVEKIAKAPLWIDSNSGLTPLEVRAKARRVDREARAAGKKLSLVAIDYLQLMTTGGRIENRQQEVAAISRQMKGLALEIKAPVLALSQLSRAPEKRGESEPQLSDLRDSGAIEQDADIVLFIHRDAKDVDGGNQAQLLIRKHRNGALAEIDVAFLGDIMRFELLYQGAVPEEMVEVREEG